MPVAMTTRLDCFSLSMTLNFAACRQCGKSGFLKDKKTTNSRSQISEGRNARIGNKMRHLEQQQVLTLTCSKKSIQKRLIAHNWTSLVSRNVRRYIHYILMCTERCELLVLGTKRNSSALMFGLLHQSIVYNNCSSYLHGRYSVVNVRSSARHCSVVHARRCLVNYSKIVKRWLEPESNEGVPRTTLLVI